LLSEQAKARPASATGEAAHRPSPWYRRILGGGRRTQKSEPGKDATLIRQQPAKFAFGQPLHTCPLVDGVPQVLTELRRVLWERRGQLSEGIFRVSAAASELQEARQLAEAGQFDALQDVDCVAQLIKLWFKELPQSILEPQLKPIVDGVPQDGEQCAQVVQQMPELNLCVIDWLLRLFCDICRHEAENRMTAMSLTIVFAPNLFDPPLTVDPMLALELNKRVVRFLERLFDYWNQHGSLTPPSS
jgi:hypothetical protein